MTLNKLLFAIAVFFLMFSCVNHEKHPGYVYLPDMATDIAYSTNADDTLENGRLVLTKPVEGTVPREMKPYHLNKANKQHKFEAGKELHNPYSLTDSTVIKKGRELFFNYCLNCHGEKGDGKGYLHTSGKYMYPPAKLNSEKYDTVPDGKLFHFITVGSGIMKSRASQISNDERWKIITYIRSID